MLDTDRDPEDLTTLIKGGRKKLALKSYDDTPNPVPDTPEEPKRQSHKNTKRWCKGVPGREHVRKILTYEETLTTPQQKARYQEDLKEWARRKAAGLKEIWWHFPRRNTIICAVCHKHLGWEERKNV